jgi:hypothetical protein
VWSISRVAASPVPTRKRRSINRRTPVRPSCASQHPAQDLLDGFKSPSALDLGETGSYRTSTLPQRLDTTCSR